MNPLAKKKERTQAREYLRKHPDCTYEKLIKDLGITSLTKPYFFNIRGALRKSGEIPTISPKEGQGGESTLETPKTAKNMSDGITMEILHTMDAQGLTAELREHWKAVVLPVLKSLLPNGQGVTLAFLSDPSAVEIRRTID